ncbi:MAG: hypothetical protein IJF71_02965 [Clostridia bacterium]|nr:hypothetical protein [Clostridia bacterium]
MKRKPITLLAVAILVLAMVCSFVGCGDNEDPSGNNPGGDKPAESVIKAVTAKEDSVTLRVGEKKLLTLYYNITGTSGSLTAAQKACTATVSDANILKLAPNGKTIECMAAGNATVTITSNLDNTKSCTFNVVVKEVYFDRDISILSPDDQMDNEMIEDGGYIVTSGMIQGDYYVKGVASTKWYVETDITYIKVDPAELYPKVGITSTTADYTAESGAVNNKVVFFLDIFRPDQSSSWANIGVCEVQNGSNWAWNDTITNATARHNDAMYTLSDPIEANETFKLAVARDGFVFHVWVNGNYAGSIKVIEELFGLWDDAAAAYVPVPSMVGFFEFNSEVKFANYLATADAAQVDAKIATIGEVALNENWAAD